MFQLLGGDDLLGSKKFCFKLYSVVDALFGECIGIGIGAVRPGTARADVLRTVSMIYLYLENN